MIQNCMKVRYSNLAEYLSVEETQESLAERLRVAQPTISRALRGKGSYRTLWRIAKATGVPLESFHTREKAA